ncbi:MAG: DUF362 domain-containing protein [Planctomycetota bacterium]|jgi:uncharacterized protein (DUF362 family)
MSNPIVVLTRCSDYGEPNVSEAIGRQFELLGGLERFVRAGDRVLLKPNFIAPRSRRHAAQTDPAVLLAAARLLKDFGAKPFIGDSPAWSNVFACVKALRMEERLKELGVPVKQLDKPKRCRIGNKGVKVGISSAALEADVIINLPKFKTHQQLVATFAVKNMFGCVSGKQKAVWHFVKGKREGDFCGMLIDIYRYLGPAVTIIDAVTVMDGPGPIRGRARPLGYLIGGTAPIALERVCCKLVNIDPRELPIVRTAEEIGFGVSDFEEIEIVGDDLPEAPCGDFELPELIGIRFSLLHVCKSIGKQMVLLAKSAVKKIGF